MRRAEIYQTCFVLIWDFFSETQLQCLNMKEMSRGGGRVADSHHNDARSIPLCEEKETKSKRSLTEVYW